MRISKLTMFFALAIAAIIWGCDDDEIVNKVTGVTLDKTTLQITEGDSQTLVATIQPKEATNKNVTWSSADATIAKVDNNGMITAIKAGNTTITVTTEDGGKTATCKVTVKAKVIPVTEVKLDKTTITKVEEETEQLTATVLPENATNKNVTWSSADAKIAKVDNKGLVTALKAGSTTITATTEDGGKTATCKVTVKAKVISVTEVKLDKTEITKAKGETEQLTATVLPENATNKNVTWSSADTQIATVDNNGLVTAVKIGTTTITVTTEDGGKTATCKVTVTPVAVTEVQLNKTEINPVVGDTEQLTATVLPENASNKNVTWNSADATIAKVDNNGLVTALKVGSTTVTVTTEDGGKTATCKVIIKPTAVTDVQLNKTEINPVIGNMEQLTATVLPENATNKNVTWSSADATIATVDNNGLVTALKVGSTTVTVTTEDGGKTAICKVTVKEKATYPADQKILVKGGTFKMGSPDGKGTDKERPQHEVTISDFYIGKYEVTNAQFVVFLNAKGNQSEDGAPWIAIDDKDCQIYEENGKFKVKQGKEDYPVMEVRWYGAKAYAEWIGGRLPTEAEWEYAARGGNKSKGYKFSGSDNSDDVAWYFRNSQSFKNNLYNGRGTHIVGKKQANELGIYDMSGNVWEWCEDTWHKDYNGAPTDGTAWVDENNKYRVIRGGSWSSFSDNSCRVANRFFNSPTSHYYNYGFRVVFEP